jgi:hypothetical protein
MELAERVAAILKHAPGEALCASCLAFACSVSVTEMRGVVERLIASDRTFEQDSSCASCRRTVPSIVYRERSRKCAHCSRPVEHDSESLVIDGDMFHATCLSQLIADENIRLSSALGGRSRELIEESRRRIREGQG